MQREKNNKIIGRKRTVRAIEKIVELENDLKKLPALSEFERAKLNQEIAISHLYYSSKIEGTQLTEKQIDRAIHGQEKVSAN